MEAVDDQDVAPVEPLVDDDQEKNDDAAENQEYDKPEASKDDKELQRDRFADRDADPDQIDSSAPQKYDDTTQVGDDRDKEIHDKYIGSDQGDEATFVNPYENDEPLMLEINSKSKAKCLKKVILEKKSLEGSQMILFKQTCLLYTSPSPRDS